MPVSKAQQKAVSKYMKENYDEIKVRTQKGRRALIKAHAEAHGESTNSFINRAIDEAMERDSMRGTENSKRFDAATSDDLEVIRAARSEYAKGETVSHEAINWD